MVEVKMTWNTGSKVVSAEENESCVWKEVGKILPDLSVPNHLDVSVSGYGDASLCLGKRGTFIKDGVPHPSMYVTVTYNHIYGLPPSKYEEKYLTCINSAQMRDGTFGRGNYKFYRLIPIGNPTTEVDAEYGRIGAQAGEMYAPKHLQTPYESYLFWIRYYEKLSKGYVDRTKEKYDLRSKKPKTVKKAEAVSTQVQHDPVSEELYRKLIAFARHVVRQNLVSDDVTESQVTACRRILNKLRERKTVNGFNRQLQNLVTLSPRRVEYVQLLMAVKKEDFPRIIDREENLLAAMEALVYDDNKDTSKPVSECFENYGIEVHLATDAQRQQVLDHLSKELQGKVKNIYRVIPMSQQVRFDKYLKDKSIKVVKQFWHGSRNENWFSILTNGLVLRPNAQITGKMLGDGIYFAPSSMKSWGYTSYRGTYWAKGQSNTAFMGLYATAYGKPLDASHDIRRYTKSELDSKGKNCVHAKAGAGGWLRNDEVVFYDESAVVLNYLVEFED